MNFRSNFMHWNLEKEFVDGYWDYFSNGLYNDLDFNIKTNEKFSNKLGVSYNHYLGRRYKSQNDAYDIGKDKVWTDDIALFINGEYEIAKPLKVFYGGRFYYAKYGDTDFSNFSPRLALTYSINKNLYVKAIYGQSFRIPTYFEKEVESNSVIGNPDLLPEQSTSYDFVISSIVKGVQFDVGFFHTEINDRILRVSSPDDPNLKTNLNTGSIILTGAELNSKFRLKDKIFGFFGYSYTQGKDLETNEDLQYVYDNMVNFGANLKLANWISANASLKYLSNWGAADAYTLINLGMSLQPSKEMPLEIEFKIDNIFDTDVYLPEIARRSEAVPVIPKTLSRLFFVGASFSF